MVRRQAADLHAHGLAKTEGRKVPEKSVGGITSVRITRSDTAFQVEIRSMQNKGRSEGKS